MWCLHGLVSLRLPLVIPTLVYTTLRPAASERVDGFRRAHCQGFKTQEKAEASWKAHQEKERAKLKPGNNAPAAQISASMSDPTNSTPSIASTADSSSQGSQSSNSFDAETIASTPPTPEPSSSTNHTLYAQNTQEEGTYSQDFGQDQAFDDLTPVSSQKGQGSPNYQRTPPKKRSSARKRRRSPSASEDNGSPSKLAKMKHATLSIQNSDYGPESIVRTYRAFDYPRHDEDGAGATPENSQHQWTVSLKPGMKVTLCHYLNLEGAPSSGPSGTVEGFVMHNSNHLPAMTGAKTDYDAARLTDFVEFNNLKWWPKVRFPGDNAKIICAESLVTCSTGDVSTRMRSRTYMPLVAAEDEVGSQIGSSQESVL